MAASRKHEVTGGFVQLDGESFYKISHVQQMPAFFINVASNSDIWMFLSSNGSLTAGRKNADRAIFPYETDDKIHLNQNTGPKTIVRVNDGDGGKISLWEPFDRAIVNPYQITRNLYKNIWGNALVYEEINETLQLSFRQKWESSERFGVIRTASVVNLSDNSREISVFDGLQNLLPYGIEAVLQQGSSCLSDAYKRAELCEQTLAIYALSSKIVDMPEPVEILHANIVWSLANRSSQILLSAEQIKAFCNGEPLREETLSLGKKCAYFTVQSFTLGKDEAADWMMVLEVCQTQAAIAGLQKKLAESAVADLISEIKADIAAGTDLLKAIVAAADGLQCTNDSLASKHHFVNVLYNNMRGGVFDDGYTYDYEELLSFVALRDKSLVAKHQAFFDSQKENPHVISLKEAAFQTGNADIIRMTLEFLPICFSRRHGDPSRPWNHFSINLKDENGKRLYHYEGNWRDIFQNWESMCLSFPAYIENVIAKFVNASTADGYNPYRINKEGIDWEVPEPHNPFSGLGYWGDHQIVYLTKLLEALRDHQPSAIKRLLANDVFCYADVPYRIHSYDQILRDSKNTIHFDEVLHAKRIELAKAKGSDGRLLLQDDQVYYCSFMEKLAVPVLAKLANLVVGGGIWMNTQRPEWNDANNAIVGNGLSMVTVYQLRRHLVLLMKLLADCQDKQASITNEVLTFAKNVFAVLEKYAPLLSQQVTDHAKKEILDGLGSAFSEYRETLYTKGFSGKTTVAYEVFTSLFTLALRYIDYTIDANKDGNLYHAYNILKIDNEQNSLTITNLYPMLEGQTTVLGSGKLSPKEAVALVSEMENSLLYSEEQSSFYLYPLKTLKTFMEKGLVPKKTAEASKLLQALVANGDKRLVLKDELGNLRLNENMVQLKIFTAALESLRQDEAYKDLVEQEWNMLHSMYDDIFKHREFTGRSGIMYKYEGIGCIYWHQNAKFLLSLEEMMYQIAPSDREMLPELKQMYDRLRNGLGFAKEPKVWGAFPLDPYSHTPYLQGAQQPGMTGQVKEEILTRRLELGTVVKDGAIHFVPELLRKSEFLEQETSFTYYDLQKKFVTLTLPKDSLAYTLCQVPVLYHLAEEEKVVCKTKDGDIQFSSLCIDKDTSQKIFLRDGSITCITVSMRG